MAKKRNNKSKAAKAVPSRALVPRVIRTNLDRMAAAYAQLLVDPCKADLAYPVYGGADGSYLLRFEHVVTFGTGAGITAGFVSWTPGAVGSSEVVTTDDRGIIRAAAATSGTAVTPVAAGTSASGTYGPGRGWLRLNASSYRPVAACATLMYPGAELDRSGILGYGIANAGMIGEFYTDSQTTTVDNVLTQLPNMQRTPNTAVELNWRPSDADSLWHNPDDTIEDDAFCRKNAIVWAWSGLKAEVGITCKLTVVYEYKPKLGSGMVQSGRQTRSSNTLAQVLDYIDRTMRDPWVRSAAYSAASNVAAFAVQRYARGMPYRVEL